MNNRTVITRNFGHIAQVIGVDVANRVPLNIKVTIVKSDDWRIGAYLQCNHDGISELLSDWGVYNISNGNGDSDMFSITDAEWRALEAV